MNMNTVRLCCPICSLQPTGKDRLVRHIVGAHDTSIADAHDLAKGQETLHRIGECPHCQCPKPHTHLRVLSVAPGLPAALSGTP